MWFLITLKIGKQQESSYYHIPKKISTVKNFHYRGYTLERHMRIIQLYKNSHYHSRQYAFITIYGPTILIL